LLRFDRRFLIVAIICGAVAAITLYTYLQGVEKKVTASSHYTQIAVAARPLLIRTRIEKEDIHLVRIPRSTKEEGDLSTVEEAVGKVITTKLLAGQKLKRELLLPANKLGGITHQIPPLWRAVTISTDEVNSIAGMLVPGDRVDLLAFLREEQRSRVLAKDREVLAVGQQTGLQPSEDEKKPLSITLLVRREEAAQIALAEETGRIRIALRPFGGEPELPLPRKAIKPAPRPRSMPQQLGSPKPVFQPTPAIVMPESEPEPEVPILLIHGSKLQEVWP